MFCELLLMVMLEMNIAGRNSIGSQYNDYREPIIDSYWRREFWARLVANEQRRVCSRDGEEKCSRIGGFQIL